MSKPIEGGYGRHQRAAERPVQGGESVGAESARRSTTTIIPAAIGFELLSLQCAGEVCRRPIVGWAVTQQGYGASTTGPIALGLVVSCYGRG
jgi:hypothetical protein